MLGEWGQWGIAAGGRAFVRQVSNLSVKTIGNRKSLRAER